MFSEQPLFCALSQKNNRTFCSILKTCGLYCQTAKASALFFPFHDGLAESFFGVELKRFVHVLD